MIARLWSGQNKLYWLLVPLSLLYGAIVGLRRFGYRIGLLKSWKAPVPVVVVGNLTVGGNGKTPLVIWLVTQLQQRGLRVGVVSRGYGSQATSYPFLIDENTSAKQGGDEPVLIFQRTKVPIAIAPDRVSAVKALLAANALDIILTDDGLQHYALDRDYEIVVVDSQRKFGNGWWLPAGPMRESAGRLRHIDAIVMNGKHSPLPNSLIMTIAAHCAVNIVTGEKKTVSELPHLVAMAGIGYPQRFFDTVTSLGGLIEQKWAFDDHQQYHYNDLKCLTTSSQNLIMTEKDKVKCQSFAQPNWWYLPIDATFSHEHATDFLNKIVARVSNSQQKVG